MILSPRFAIKSPWFVVSLFIFFACPKKTNQKKRHFSVGIATLGVAPQPLARFSPRLRKSLTPLSATLRKRVQSFALIRVYPEHCISSPIIFDIEPFLELSPIPCVLSVSIAPFAFLR